MGQESKLLILSEYMNKNEKIGGMWTYTNSYRENEALSDIFMFSILEIVFIKIFIAFWLHNEIIT